MKLTDEQQEALDRHWKELFEDVVPTEPEMVAYGYLYGYFKRGYVAAKNETCECVAGVEPEQRGWYSACGSSFDEKTLHCPNCGNRIETREEK